MDDYEESSKGMDQNEKSSIRMVDYEESSRGSDDINANKNELQDDGNASNDVLEPTVTFDNENAGTFDETNRDLT